MEPCWAAGDFKRLSWAWLASRRTFSFGGHPAAMEVQWYRVEPLKLGPPLTAIGVTLSFLLGNVTHQWSSASASRPLCATPPHLLLYFLNFSPPSSLEPDRMHQWVSLHCWAPGILLCESDTDLQIEVCCICTDFGRKHAQLSPPLLFASINDGDVFWCIAFCCQQKEMLINVAFFCVSQLFGLKWSGV